MSWRKALFKDKEVWIAVDTTGLAVVSGGRVQMRYSKSEGAKIYRPGSRNVTLDEDSSVEELPPGQSADAAPASRTGSGFGKAGTRTAQQKAMAAAAAPGARGASAGHHCRASIQYECIWI